MIETDRHERQTEIDRQAAIKTDSQTDRQANRQTNRGRQAGSHRDRQPDI